MNDEVYMDVPAVREIAKNLQTLSETLSAVVKALEALINTLKAVAFIGSIGVAAFTLFLEVLKPGIEDKAEKFAELSKDVNAAVEAFVRGDNTGALRFH
jgi:uncharacterized protein YukE